MKLYENLGHGRPLSRREMLARSACTVSAAAVVPSLTAALLRATLADGAPQGSGEPGLVPLLVFDLNGGAALPGNFLVGRDEQLSTLLASYDLLGWNPKEAGALDAALGLPMAANASQMLAGMKQTASAAALGKLRFGSFCHISQDDSSINRSSVLTLASAAGLNGSLISGGVGLTESESGGNSDSALQDPTRKPMTVRSLNDFLDAVSYGPALQDLPPRSLAALANGTLKLSTEQARKLANLDHGAQLARLAGDAYQKNLAYAGAPVTGIDPRTDDVFKALYGIDASTKATSADAIFAGIVMNVLRGNCGPGVLTIDGCDYHTGVQTDGDAKDLQIGREIGRAVEAACRLGRPLFLQLLTDGGLYASPGTRNWLSDAGDKSMTVIGYFNPAAAPAQRRLQVGAFTDGQSADRSTAVGSDPSLAAYAAFANYLNVSGKLARFAEVVPGVPFDDETLKSVLIFGA